MQITDEMRAHFIERTTKHISLFQRNLLKVIRGYLPSSEVLDELSSHDSSKFTHPERVPYIHITWMYKLKRDGVEASFPEDLQVAMQEATNHHVKNNKHHPEYWAPDSKMFINLKDRDKPPEELVDATKMPDKYIACMVADWLAVSEERGTDPYKWAKDNINVRWKFDSRQEDLLYSFLDMV